jgi:hypothetical protein
VSSLQVHEAAVVEHLDQVQRAGLLGEQGHRLVVLPQGRLVSAAALEQQAPLGQQDRPLRRGDPPLRLVEQPEAVRDPAPFRFGPGQADQQPGADLGGGRAAVRGPPGQPQPGAQLAHRGRGPAVVTGGQGGRVQAGGPFRCRPHVTR